MMTIRFLSRSLAFALILAAALLGITPAEAQVCSGTVMLDSQEEVDAFACTEVTGSLFVGGGEPSDITDLAPLSSLTSISGSLGVRNNPLLESFAGLEGLTSIGISLEIEDNVALASLVGLDNLTSITGGIDLFGSDVLESLEGLGGLVSVGTSIFISDNPALSSLAGTNNLSVAQLTLADNNGLESLAGIEGFAAIGFLALLRNTGMTSLDGLGTLDLGSLQIDGLDGLTSLSGLEGLGSVDGSIFIRNNVALGSLDGLEGLTSVGESLSIVDNDALASLDGLESLASVGEDVFLFGNDDLESLDGLEGLTSIGENLTIQENTTLEDCRCGLAGLLSVDGDEFSGVDGSVTIQDNASGGQCNAPEDVLEAKCLPVATEGAAPDMGYALSAAWPNPTTDRAALTLSVEHPQHVTVEVVDLLGRRVAMLFEGLASAGSPHRFALDNVRLAGGTYVVRVRGKTFAANRRITVLR